MPSGRQAAAYPSLIPGNQDGARDPHKPWDVIELAPDAARGGNAGSTTSKQGRILKIPPMIMQSDMYIRYHELCHVERPDWPESPNKTRNTMRQMLEEVAIDGMAYLRDGIDQRECRDHYDWKGYRRPSNIYQAVAIYFQVWGAAAGPGTPCSDPELLKLFADAKQYIADAEAAESKLAGISQVVESAADGVFNDYSSGNCEDWADIVTARLLGVPKEEIPNEPAPPGNPGGNPSGAGDSTDTDPGSDDEAEDDDSGGPDSEPEGGSGDGEGVGEGDEPCATCGGEGVDDDGDECPECGGTGAAGSDGSEDPEDGDQQMDAEDDSVEDPGGSGHSEWDTPPVDLSKAPVNQRMEFKFDPLGKTEGIDPHERPPEKNWRDREIITKQQLQDEMDRERVNRKQGEASQATEITARTPHGAVDVHRHTLGKSTSTSVSLGWRSTQDGVTVRYPSQMFPDGRVFAKRAPGGSIILDGSGSMDWHTQHIVEAQKKMPNLYVAVYSYHGGNGYWKASKGYVADDTFIARYCIVAQNGRLDPNGVTARSTELTPDGKHRCHTGGNSGADPAALYYAANNGAPKPLVWVSDGMVSFDEEQRFWRQCDELMLRHKIVRVLTIQDAIDYLLGKAVPGWHQCASVDTKWVRVGQPMHQTPTDPSETYSEAARWAQRRSATRT